MKRSGVRNSIIIVLIAAAALTAWLVGMRNNCGQAPPEKPFAITIDYPAEGSIFPPEFPAPTWLWRDPDDKAVSWEITISFSDGSPSIHALSQGERMRIGESDPRCFSATNKPPELTPEQAAAHTWAPDSAAWSAIKKHSIDSPAIIVITGHRRGDPKTIVSRGRVSIRTSRDPVGAPIFYRDVPLMPSQTEKGVIKPLDPNAVPLISWRLRNIAETQSRVLMEGLHTCANCHSFSADGKTLGMDMDGPNNDKGLYAIVKITPRMSIRAEDQVAWSTFRGKLGSKLRVGFMSQLSPDGRYVITSVNDPGIEQSNWARRRNPKDLVKNYYIANFTDYRFLQVFYPTRGVLAWYSRESGHLQYLPGADDTRYVQANAVWSPDGNYLVFARAKARDAYPANAVRAEYANDSNETQIKYDLYRVPFNGGKGGTPEPIAGASNNGMSNSFPKISPDGRWIVFVQARNGLLMRPDGQLFIVPAHGGTARLMKCNTALMNSWHSFSPNGRWMVFSSKSRSPYTQMYLTHLSESGEDSPPIFIENSTAANRAVNIPEFVNIPYNGIEKIDAPAAEYALHTDLALESMKNNEFRTAVQEWNKALLFAPQEPWVHNNLGFALMESGKTDEAIARYRKALTLDPRYSEAYANLGEALAGKGANKEAVVALEKAVQLDSASAIARANLGLALATIGQSDKAIFHLRKAAAMSPDSPSIHLNLGHALSDKGNVREACFQVEEAVRLSGGKDPFALFLLGRIYANMGRTSEAVETDRQALALAEKRNDAELIQDINAQINQVMGTGQSTMPAPPHHY
jgi:Flp pilus assembly protein TadD